MTSTASKPVSVPPQFDPSEDFARSLDVADPLRGFRDRFHIPQRSDGESAIYLCGNSLGLMPKAARQAVDQELDDWQRLAVDAHFKGATPWFSYHEVFRESGARLVGACPTTGGQSGNVETGKRGNRRSPLSTFPVSTFPAGAGAGPGAGLGGEVVMMNSLTVNLHLMMVSFFRPTPRRFKILIEEPAFPSDLYAVSTHLRFHDLDPRDAIVRLRPRRGEEVIRTEDAETLLDQQGDQIALVLMGGVNFFTGQVLDIARITAAAQRHGCMVGWDLAHAAGNVPLALHDWNVDFACWCSYKYLNAGPGAVAGCFVHERHGSNPNLKRLGGWWGHDPDTRFQMHLQQQFRPQRGAEGWQVSNPPILSMAPLRASLAIFDEAGMERLREKSIMLTGYLRELLDQAPANWWRLITPREPASHGCQLSIMVLDDPQGRFKALEAAGVACDFRPPNVIRVAPVPLYNSFHDCWRFAQVLSQTS